MTDSSRDADGASEPDPDDEEKRTEEEEQEDDDLVDEQGRESFPASDPPAY